MAGGRGPAIQTMREASAIKPFVQIAQDTRRRAPDIAPPMRHSVKLAHAPLPFPPMALMVRRVHQKAQRRLEDILDLVRIDIENEAGIENGDQRHDAITR